MKHHFSPCLMLFICITALFSTGFIQQKTIDPVNTVEKKVAVVFLKLSPACSTDEACKPDFPPGLRANIHEPHYSASTYAYIMNQTMTSYITEATYAHTHMVFTAIANPNSSDGWFDAPHQLEYYNDPENNPNFISIFDDALMLAFSVIGYDIDTYDALLVVNNIQSLYGYTVGCGYTAPGDYVTCPVSLVFINKRLSLVHISENVDAQSMLEVLGHELGHVHNLYHVRMGPYDIVGNSDVLTHYGGWSKYSAGWIPQVTDLNGTGEVTVTLDPLEAPGNNILRIPYVNYADVFAGYIVECRSKTGYDQKIPEEGVIISYADTSGMDGDVGLHAAIEFPEYDNDYTDAALSPGETYANVAHGFTITFISRDSNNRCIVKAIRGQIDAPDPMITPYTEMDSGNGYIEFTSKDIWIDSQENGWNVYPPGQGLMQEGGQSHPSGYGDPFWVNHENRIKYLIRNTGYSDAHNVIVDIYLTQPMLLINHCDDEISLNDASLIATQQIDLLEKDGYYYGEVPWTPTSYSAAQVKVVIRDYMGEVTHANNSASETYASQPFLTGTFDDVSSAALPGAFQQAQNLSILSELKCMKSFRYQFARKVISAIDRKYWVMDDILSSGVLSPGEEQVVPFSGSLPQDAAPGECEEAVIELRVMLDDFFVPVSGFTYKSCAVAPSKLTCTTPQQPAEEGKTVNTSVNLSPAKGGETIAIEYISPSGKHQIVNKKVGQNGTSNDRVAADEPGKWQMQAFWQGSDNSASAESDVCTFEVRSEEPSFTLNVNSNCRSGPGSAYEVVTSGKAGYVMPIMARNADGSWLYGTISNAYCWIYSGLGTFNGDKSDLPVRQPPAVKVTPTFTLSAPKTDKCSIYTTQSVCNRYKDSCQWVIQPTGGGICKSK